MKAVLISIQPKWCELIANGKKTVELRKTKPKLETPFKVYIYCTNSKPILGRCLKDGSLKQTPEDDFDNYNRDTLFKANGKVIGEFVCNKVDRIAHCGTCNSDIRLKLVDKNLYCKELDYEYLNKCKLSFFDIDEYSNGGDVYGWHISDLVIYDEPKELSEFKKPCDKKCGNCDYLDVQKIGAYGITREIKICLNFITRPPQSWCYVERSDNND